MGALNENSCKFGTVVVWRRREESGTNGKDSDKNDKKERTKRVRKSIQLEMKGSDLWCHFQGENPLLLSEEDELRLLVNSDPQEFLVGGVGAGLARLKLASGTTLTISGVLGREGAGGDDAGVAGGVGLETARGCWVGGKHEWPAQLAYQVLDVPAGEIKAVAQLEVLEVMRAVAAERTMVETVLSTSGTFKNEKEEHGAEVNSESVNRLKDSERERRTAILKGIF
ncbi:hypothetical protein IW261DRAFT_1421663 [Armillaria novae-zelandiae]|uniref:Uncharacterized protein n=1 Tax=Armillaria novae-zelandiae TaxID=153914 RepID=A0AA39U2T6_9AGAR|nr:hypothetical protein IW261DRAFT_1421663 [Armillaria novae-zelandiae]